jgi:hypothetical protein
MRWATGVGVFVLVLVIGAAAIYALGHLSGSETVAPPAPAPTEAPRLPPPPVGSQWRYTAPRAWSAAEAGVEACTKSTTDIDIGGGARSGAEFCLRRGGGYPYAASIVLGDTSGRLLCAACAVKARFDDRPAQSFDGTAASTDGTDYTLFMRDGPRLAGELKRAGVATFDVPIRGAGDQRVTFNVAGLRWN